MAAKKTTSALKKSLCIQINLLPPEYRKKSKDFTWVTDRRVIWPTVALIASIVCVYMLNMFVTETISDLQNEVERVKAEVERERPLLSKISDDMEMKGLTFDFSEVAEYMVKLEKQASVEKVSLVTISTTKVSGEEAYDFTIRVVLKKDLGSEG